MPLRSLRNTWFPSAAISVVRTDRSARNVDDVTREPSALRLVDPVRLVRHRDARMGLSFGS